MKLLRILRSTALLLAILLLNSVSLASHASAMPVMPHEMGGMSHKTADMNSCATLCRTAVVERETTGFRENENKDDDEPALPFYAQTQPWLFAHEINQQRLYAITVKPPPKVPIYILYAVLRV